MAHMKINRHHSYPYNMDLHILAWIIGLELFLVTVFLARQMDH
jgi:hypothetical protein